MVLSDFVARRGTFVVLVMFACPAAPDRPPSGTPDAAGAELPSNCARPPAALRSGDFNADGAFDVADSVAFSNHMFRGGPGPACVALVDLHTDGHLELDDAGRLRGHLVSGTAPLPPAKPGDCEAPTAWPATECVGLAVGWNAPSRTTGGRFDAAMTIESSAAVVQGWSSSVRATGCAIIEGSVTGTVAADVSEGTPALRHLGYAIVKPVAGGAIAYTELSFAEDVFLPARKVEVARFTIEATKPATGCTPCEITLGDGLKWSGEELDLAVAIGGASYRPAPASTTVQVCAD